MGKSISDVTFYVNGRLNVKGNNRFGSKGCMKCDECRRRKTRVKLLIPISPTDYSVILIHVGQMTLVVIVKDVVLSVGRHILLKSLRDCPSVRIPPPRRLVHPMLRHR
jgi:hypothetical protein